MECNFCGEEIDRGEGKIFVKKDGTSYFYCSSKCEKNHLDLKRDPKNTKWSEK